MLFYPTPIKKLIEQLARLPSIGPKGAERLVFFLLKKSPAEISELSHAISDLSQKIKYCSVCQNYAETDPCSMCQDKTRNHNLICVVAKPQDLIAIEKTSDYSGTYHVLQGTIDTLDGITPEQLTIRQLVNRLKNGQVTEVILALNTDIAGQTTLLYLTKLLKQLGNFKLTRLAQGLPIGSDLEYADEVTISSALKERKEL